MEWKITPSYRLGLLVGVAVVALLSSLTESESRGLVEG